MLLSDRVVLLVLRDKKLSIMKAKIYIATILLSIGSANTTVAQLTAYANIYATVVAPVGISDLSNESLGTIVVARNQNSAS